MVDIPVLLVRIHKFNASSRRHKIIIRGLGNVAAMVKPIGVHVRREDDFFLAGAQVATGESTTVTAARGGRTPHHALHHQQILRRLITAARMRGLPQLLSALRIKRLQQPIATGVQHYAIMHHELGPEVEANLRRPASLAATPGHISGGAI